MENKYRIKLKINNQMIKLMNSFSLVAGSENYVKINFSFSDDWNGLDKKIVFNKEGQQEIIGLSVEDILIPQELLITDGVLEVSFYGVGASAIITTAPIQLKIYKRKLVI